MPSALELFKTEAAEFLTLDPEGLGWTTLLSAVDHLANQDHFAGMGWGNIVTYLRAWCYESGLESDGEPEPGESYRGLGLK